ncbi:hypothetical protein [Bradyrhizobium neotropicale]|uniref:hypothetical protein n=1 Tax=Bradyrhizobium neotropicale TaxID=1497615 RepID=UPI001AD73D61|nr:hypothetical protein [Bradyrhizobium neotropicale]MBO4228380.1 hypothetical protein [Bradyrhizobium neotropicale]
MRLADFDPHFLQRTAPAEYEYTDDILLADGLQFNCPICRNGHVVLVWRPEWDFVGKDYSDLTLAAGRIAVEPNGGCHRLYIRCGEIHFY